MPQKYDKVKYKEIVDDILSTPKASVIILFGVDPALEPMLYMIQDQAGNRSLQFVASDSLASSINEELNKVQRITQQTFFFNLPTGRVDGFTEYFLNLSIEGNKRNPWFKDFFATFMNCTIDNSRYGGILTSNKTKCDTNKILASTNYATQVKDFTQSVPLVVDAVYAFAHALHHFLEECQKNASQPWVTLNKIPGNQILEVLRQQVFHSPSGAVVNFTKTGDVMGWLLDLLFLACESFPCVSVQLHHLSFSSLVFLLTPFPLQVISSPGFIFSHKFSSYAHHLSLRHCYT